jgi:DNA-binding response OmpR family regulator
MHAPKRILIADDDPNVVEVLRANLEVEGYHVEVARDGDQAWSALQQTTLDLVVLDVMMPGRTGLELLSLIRDNPSTANLPVVLLTAKAGDNEIWAGWQAGANYYLTKPFHLDELLHYLNYLAGNEVSA